MNSAAENTSVPDEALSSLVVLARLPHVGASTPTRPRAESLDSPILVLVDDDSLDNVDDRQQAAIVALADAAKPSRESPVRKPAQSHSSRRSSGRRTRKSSALAGRVFRLHEQVAPYSSVIVTIAVIAAAGLLLVVASQPDAEPVEYGSGWADRGLVESQSAPIETAALNPRAVPATPDADEQAALAGVTANPEPSDGHKAPRLADTQNASDVTPPARPEAILLPVERYPSTERKAFDQAWLRDATTTQ